MSRLLDVLAANLRTLRIERTRVLLAVSGGADSVALFRACLELREPLQLDLVVAHLNHRLRPSADADAVWVQALADQHAIPCELGTADSAAWKPTGIEAQARTARWEFLTAVAARRQISVILTAHTANDQAETVLHHLLRGTGLAGLAGIPRERFLTPMIRVARPLLDVSREEVEAYLQSLQQPWCTDETNTDTAFARNRIRHVILPFLQAQGFPAVLPALRRLAAQAGECQAVINLQASALLEQALRSATEDMCWLDPTPLAGATPYLVAEVCRQLWQQRHWPQGEMDYLRWTRLAEVVLHGGALDLPGQIHVRWTDSGVVFRRKSPSGF